MSHGRPFLFATGYGEDSAIAEDLSEIPVVRKPFEREAILSLLKRLLNFG
jgi:hypothetical protein